MSLPKQDTIKKGRVNKFNKPLKLEKEFEARNNKEYEVKAIIYSIVYGNETINQILGLYYLVL